MPLPVVLSPLAMTALRIGGAVAVGMLLSRRRGPERLDLASEDHLDRVPEGADLRSDLRARQARLDGEARFVRSVRLGASGPGVEIDLAALGRLRARRLRSGD